MMSSRKSIPTRILHAVLWIVLCGVPIWPADTLAALPGDVSLSRPPEGTRPYIAPEPRFHIEAFEVRGARHVSSGIVISRSLLEAGRVYTESELRDAVFRIKRLPFVLDADFALQRGTSRGHFVLVMDIVETRRFFYQFDLERSEFGNPLAVNSSDFESGEDAARLLLGGRFFVGGYSQLTAAAGDEGVQLGFTRYNLAGRGGFLALGYSLESCCSVAIEPLGLDPAFSTWIDTEDSRTANLTVGLPIGGNHSLQGRLSLRESDGGFRRPTHGERRYLDFFSFDNRSQDELRLAWLYDTTDDPVFPTRGTSFVVSLDYRSLEADLEAAESTVESFGDTVEMSSELLRLSVLGRRHWPFARRHSFAAGLSLGLGRSNVNNVPAGDVLLDGGFDSWEASATLRHSFKIFESSKKRRWRQLYWRNSVEYSWDDVEHLPGALQVLSISSEIVYRNSWGILRFGLRMIDVGDML